MATMTPEIYDRILCLIDDIGMEMEKSFDDLKKIWSKPLFISPTLTKTSDHPDFNRSENVLMMKEQSHPEINLVHKTDREEEIIPEKETWSGQMLNQTKATLNLQFQEKEERLQISSDVSGENMVHLLFDQMLLNDQPLESSQPSVIIPTVPQIALQPPDPPDPTSENQDVIMAAPSMAGFEVKSIEKDSSKMKLNDAKDQALIDTIQYEEASLKKESCYNQTSHHLQRCTYPKVFVLDMEHIRKDKLQSYSGTNLAESQFVHDIDTLLVFKLVHDKEMDELLQILTSLSKDNHVWKPGGLLCVQDQWDWVYEIYSSIGVFKIRKWFHGLCFQGISDRSSKFQEVVENDVDCFIVRSKKFEVEIKTDPFIHLSFRNEKFETRYCLVVMKKFSWFEKLNETCCLLMEFMPDKVLRCKAHYETQDMNQFHSMKGYKWDIRELVCDFIWINFQPLPQLVKIRHCLSIHHEDIELSWFWNSMCGLLFYSIEKKKLMNFEDDPKKKKLLDIGNDPMKKKMELIQANELITKTNSCKAHESKVTTKVTSTKLVLSNWSQNREAASERLYQEVLKGLADKNVIRKCLEKYLRENEIRGSKIAGGLICGDVKFHLKNKWRSKLLPRYIFLVGNVILIRSPVEVAYSVWGQQSDKKSDIAAACWVKFKHILKTGIHKIVETTKSYVKGNKVVLKALVQWRENPPDRLTYDFTLEVLWVLFSMEISSSRA